jgi:hypothetical protein
MNYSGIFTGIRSAVLTGALLLAVVSSMQQPADAVPSYDGVWSVVITTRSGICDGSYRYPIRISKGNVQNAGNAAVQITGKVGKNGSVIVNLTAGDKTATGTGRLSGKTGSGSWSGGNGACTGEWQAERRS